MLAMLLQQQGRIVIVVVISACFSPPPAVLSIQHDEECLENCVPRTFFGDILMAVT